MKNKITINDDVLKEREEEIEKFIKIFDDPNCDPRKKRGCSYQIGEIFLVVLCAIICGFESLREYEFYGNTKLLFLRKFYPYKRGIPTKSTIARIMALFDPKRSEAIFLDWLYFFRDKEETSSISIEKKTRLSKDQDNTKDNKLLEKQNQIAIDGKTHRGFQSIKDGSYLHTLHAFDVDTGMLIGQIKVNDKSNEITAIPELLDSMFIENQLVTIDAMGCQKAIASKIREKKADYVLALKENHPNLYHDVSTHLTDEKFSENFKQYEVKNKGHGRLETRRCIVTDKIQWLANKEAWADLKCIAAVERICIQKGKETKETRYYISNLNADPKKILSASRSHWGIENQLHWSLDVIFHEDDRIIWNTNMSQNEGIIRRIALNMLRKFQSTFDHYGKKTKVALKSIRKTLIGNDDNMDHLLRGKT